MADVGLAKLSRPRLGTLQARERLNLRIDEGRLQPAVWIVGPPGAGKTTLVAHYIQQRRVRELWYQVDPGDGDPASLFHHLCLAARHASGSRAAALPAFAPESFLDLPGFATRFGRALYAILPAHTLLVFDNVQEAPEASPFLGMLHALISEAPPGHTVIAISRLEPPPVFARLMASQAVLRIGWDELRLTEDEARRIAAAALPGGSAGIDQLVQRCGGWVAGLTLLVQHARSRGGDAAAIDTREALFDYFAAELFDELPAETRRLLLQTALLPWVTLEAARALAGHDRVGAVLEGLRRQHLFTDRREGGTARYQFHALFREFLGQRLRTTLTPAELAELAQRSARLLEADDEPDDALRLYLSAGDEDAAVRLVLGQAPRLAAQGRLQTLAGWIQQLPATGVDSEPWLVYWSGMCAMGQSPPLARQRLEAAYQGFEARGDVLGRTVAAAGMIESVNIDYSNFTLTDRWTDALAELLAQQPRFPTPGLELGVLASFVASSSMRYRHLTLLPLYAERIRVLLPITADVNERLFGASRLLNYATFHEGRQQAERLIAYVAPLLKAPTASPLNRFMLLHLQTMFYVFRGEGVLARDSIDAAIEVIEDNGLHFLSILLHAIGALVAFSMDDEERAAEYLRRATPQLGAPTFDMGWYDGMCLQQALREGRHQDALHFARRLVDANLASGVVGGIGLAYVFQANARLASGDAAGARASLDAARPCIGALPFAQFSIDVVEADLLVHSGALEPALEVLRRALALSRQHDQTITMQWLPAQMARLCALALAHGIEPGQVRAIVRARRLRPPSPQVTEWPWPVVIRALGSFEVRVDDQPLQFERKAQRRPMDLLKALVALGGRDVPEDRLIEAVWTEPVDGDERKTFDVTLHRLRKLLVHDRCIRVTDRRVSLNEELVGLDVWQFERRLAELGNDGHGQEHPATDFEAAAPGLLALYRGHLLADEPDAAWLLPARHRLQARLQRLIVKVGEARELRGDWDAAEALYARGIELDPFAELYYHRLMICLEAQGRRTEAMEVFFRLRKVLSMTFGVKPGRQVEAAYQQLLAS